MQVSGLAGGRKGPTHSHLVTLLHAESGWPVLQVFNIASGFNGTLTHVQSIPDLRKAARSAARGKPPCKSGTAKHCLLPPAVHAVPANAVRQG